MIFQGGPVQKISIPKDRDGKQRNYGFVTYKHIHSVGYALRLFEGTMLYNRLLSMKPRNSSDSNPTDRLLDSVCHMDTMLQLGQQMILGNYPLRINSMACDNKIPSPYPSQLDINSGNDDRNLKRMHPYQRDRDRNRERDRPRDRERDRERDRNRDRDRDRSKEWERNRERGFNDHHKDERSHYNRDNNYRSNDYSRYNDARKRWSYH